MDLPCGLWGLGTPGDGPGAALVLAAGEVGDEAQEGIACPDEPVQSALGDAQVLQEERLLLRRELGDLRFQLGADRDDLGPLRLGPLGHLAVVRYVLAVREARLV